MRIQQQQMTPISSPTVSKSHHHTEAKHKVYGCAAVCASVHEQGNSMAVGTRMGGCECMFECVRIHTPSTQAPV